MAFDHNTLALLIDNDREAYEAVYAITISTIKRLYGSKALEEMAPVAHYVKFDASDFAAVGDSVRDYITDVVVPTNKGSLRDCILSQVLSQIDWRAVGKYYIEASLERWQAENAEKV